jgi:hypothetical protein
MKTKKMPVKSEPAPESKKVRPISERAFTEIESIVNASLRELVFGVTHVDNHDAESAQECFTTVGMNVDRIQEIICASQGQLLRRDLSSLVDDPRGGS